MTLLLTRARLVTHRSRAQSVAAMLQKAAAADAGHGLIWSLFPQDDQVRRFLYRETGPGEYLILSEAPPRDELSLWSLETRDYAPELVAGDRLSFSLRADVQINAAPEGLPGERRRGRREPLHAAAKRLGLAPQIIARDWLMERLKRQGATLLTMTPKSDEALSTELSDAGGRELLKIQVEPRQRLSGGSKAGSLQPVLFEGAIEVSDATAFKSLLSNGLGKSRGYGCGLFLVRRL